MSTYVLTQVLINLLFLGGAIYLIVKGNELGHSEKDSGKARTYKIIGIVIIVLLVLSWLGPLMPKE